MIYNKVKAYSQPLICNSNIPYFLIIIKGYLLHIINLTFQHIVEEIIKYCKVAKNI